MPEFTLSQTMDTECPLEEVFKFFSRAENLELITPSELNFRILTPLPISMRRGTLIDYEIRLYGFPMKWQTEITGWDPPHSFTDKQLRGPYKQWIHTHRFTELGPGLTRIEDEVKYRLPFEPFGLAAFPLVKRQLDYIFAFRKEKIAQIFNSNQTG